MEPRWRREILATVSRIGVLLIRIEGTRRGLWCEAEGLEGE